MPAKKSRSAAGPPDFLAEAQRARRREKLTLPGMTRTAFACALSAAAVNRITRACLKPGKRPEDDDAYDNEALTRYIVAASCVDERGRRLVPEGREDELEDLPNDIRMAMQMPALRVNGMAVEDPAPGKD